MHLTLHPKITNELIRESLPLATLSVADRIKLYLPSIVLAYTAGEAAVGLFQAANKIVVFPMLINGVVGAGIFPAMSAAVSSDGQAAKLYRYGVRMLWHVLLPCSVLTLFFAQPLIRLIFGAAYEPAASALRILTPFYLLNVIVTMSYVFNDSRQPADPGHETGTACHRGQYCSRRGDDAFLWRAGRCLDPSAHG